MLIGSALTSVLGQVIKACRNDEKVRRMLGLPTKIDVDSCEALSLMFKGMDEVSCG